MLFPDPETPVTHIKHPSGIFTLMSFKLFCLAPLISRKEPLLFFLFVGVIIFFIPERYCPVKDTLSFKSFLGSPEKTTSPPWIPAQGLYQAHDRLIE